MELQPVYEKEMPPFLEGHAAPPFHLFIPCGLI